MDDTNKLKYGVWLKGTDIHSIRDVSFDYLEMEFRTVASMDNSSFHNAYTFLQERAINVMSMNCFIPKGYTILSPAFKNDITSYLEEGFKRARQLDTKYVIFGSPSSRKRPEEMSKKRFEEVFVDNLSYICEIADRYGIKIVLEPICIKESNTINTVEEADMIARKTGCSIGTLCDLYHMTNMEEDLSVLQNYKSLCHCHIMNPFTRYCPLQEDEYNYLPFLMNVIRTAQIGSVTIEVPINICHKDINKSIGYLSMLETMCNSHITEEQIR